MKRADLSYTQFLAVDRLEPLSPAFAQGSTVQGSQCENTDSGPDPDSILLTLTLKD